MGFLLEFLIDLLLDLGINLDDPLRSTERTKTGLLVAAVVLMFIYFAYLAIRGWQTGDDSDLFIGCALFLLLLAGVAVVAWQHRKG